MQANVSAAMARILASEGGLRVSPQEPGGASNRGVSLLAYGEYRAAHGLPAPSLSGLEAISDDDANAFYQWQVLAPIRFNDLPSGVDYAIADFAVNSGVAGALDAVRFLYGIAMPPAKWRMDDALFAALDDAEPGFAICAICDLRWAMMQAAHDFTSPSIVPEKILGDGRAFRVSSAFRGAMEMTGHAPVADRYQVFR